MEGHGDWARLPGSTCLLGTCMNPLAWQGWMLEGEYRKMDEGCHGPGVSEIQMLPLLHNLMKLKEASLNIFLEMVGF